MVLVKKFLVIGLIIVLLVIAFILSISIGSMAIPVSEIIEALFNRTDESSQYALIIWQIRIPRTLLGMAAGSVLAISGVAMQGLFRNALADPGLIGISSGAALGAAFAIVFGSSLAIPANFEPYFLSTCAFLGSLLITWFVYRLGQRDGRTDVATMLLAGIALTALAGAGIGLFTYLANDSMLRKLTFWNMGSLSDATYNTLWPVLVVSIVVCCWLPLRSSALNAFLLGEAEARHLGVNVERLKIQLVLCCALGVGCAVAATGMIGFVGLVVPHLIRLLIGPNHRTLLPAAALAGAALLLLADVLARVVLAPAELQLGIVTAFLGAPFFLYLLLKRRY